MEDSTQQQVQLARVSKGTTVTLAEDGWVLAEKLLAASVGLASYSILLTVSLVVGEATGGGWVIWVAIPCGFLIACVCSVAFYRLLTAALDG